MGGVLPRNSGFSFVGIEIKMWNGILSLIPHGIMCLHEYAWSYYVTELIGLE